VSRVPVLSAAKSRRLVALLAAAVCVLALAPTAASAVSFQTPFSTYATGVNPVGSAVADFNGDGKPDVAISNNSGSSVTIFLGTGSGTFGAGKAVATSSTPRWLAAGDLNNDGKIDLAVPCAGSGATTANNVNILLGNGDGTFKTAIKVSIGLSARTAAIGDLNKDGIPDIVVGNQGSTFSVLIGKGNAEYQPVVQVNPVEPPAAVNPRMLALADFNGDGNLDVATANFATNNISVLFGKGNGSFEAPQTYTDGPAEEGLSPNYLVTPDLNGDGKPDVVVTNQNSANMGVYINNGNGTFPTATLVKTGITPSSIGVGDFNSDSKSDLAVANTQPESASESLSVYTGDGSGGFSSKTDFNAGSLTGGVSVAQLNGGSAPDIALVNSLSNTMTVMLGIAEPTLSTTASSATLGSSISDQAVLAGGSNPTGSITFTAYGPGDETCSGAPAYSSGPVSVSGNGTYNSGSFTPGSAGEYRWVASYSGDGENKAVSGACNDAGETSTVTAVVAKHTLKVTKSGTGSARITSSPAGIDCKTVCEASLPEGLVTLTAEPFEGASVSWTGCDEATGNTCKVNLTTNRTVSAFINAVTCTGSNIVAAGTGTQAVAQTSVWPLGFKAFCPSSPTVTYESTSGSDALAEWNATGTKGSINTGLAFVTTDGGPNATEIANIKSQAGSAQMAVVPVAQTAIAVLANPPAGCTVEAITNSNLAGVMEGRITSWSKVETAEGSCNAPITRVVRKDAGDTTTPFKGYLQRLYPNGLSCTTGGTEGKASWQELASTAWPESCKEKTLSPVVRPASDGGAALVAQVNATAGSIGYASLPEAMAGKAGSTAILSLQNNGQKKAAEANFADPASGSAANCASMTYTVPSPLNTARDIDWSGVVGARPAIGSKNYPLCTLTYAVAFHGYAAAGFSEGQFRTVRDYLFGYVVQPQGQSAIEGNYYLSLPTSPATANDVLGAARRAAAAITY
jgi:VCBS repeat protein